MTEITKKFQNITDILNEIDDYSTGLANKLSEVDQKIQDLLHYIEYNKINILWSYKYIVELKKLRLERRKIKNDMLIIDVYNKHKSKLPSYENRKFFMTEMYKMEKQLEAPYKNRQYKEGEIEKILEKSDKND